MTAQKILKMIEEVDPSDERKMDEIDYETECYLRKNQNPLWSGTKYTRSRDALKSIRPDGFHWEVGSIIGGKFYCHMTNRDYLVDGQTLFSSHVFKPTEELAELHAIIQAIEYERSK